MKHPLLAVLLVSLAGGAHLAAPANPQPRFTEAQFSREWEEVKTRYPAVADAFLKRDAVVREMVAVRDHCGTLRAAVLPVPAGCPTLAKKPSVDISSCFKPRPAPDGGYAEPDEVETCLDRLWRRRTP